MPLITMVGPLCTSACLLTQPALQSAYEAFNLKPNYFHDSIIRGIIVFCSLFQDCR